MSNEPTLSQAKHTLELIVQQKLTTEHLKRLHDGALTDLIQAITRGKLPPREKVREFYGLEPLDTETASSNLKPDLIGGADVLVVDYSRNLEQMIAAGRYGGDGDNWNRDITFKRFPIVGSGIAHLEFAIFDFGRAISSDDAVEAIRAYDKTNPWEPAKTEHTLAYGASYTGGQKKNPIIGLGSSATVDGDICVLRLRLRVSGRDHRLGLDKRNVIWTAQCGFLAIRIIPQIANS